LTSYVCWRSCRFGDSYHQAQHHHKQHICRFSVCAQAPCDSQSCSVQVRSRCLCTLHADDANGTHASTLFTLQANPPRLPLWAGNRAFPLCKCFCLACQPHSGPLYRGSRKPLPPSSLQPVSASHICCCFWLFCLLKQNAKPHQYTRHPAKSPLAARSLSVSEPTTYARPESV